MSLHSRDLIRGAVDRSIGLWRYHDLRRLRSYEATRTARDHIAMTAAITVALGADGVLVDVGAHAGTIVDIAHKVAPSSGHVAYEALPRLASHLQRRYPNLDVRQKAVSDIAGRVTFYHVVDAPGYSGLAAREHAPGASSIEALEVEAVRLDDDLSDDVVPAVLKIDVEGAEVKVLRGAANMLSRYRPILLFEHGVGGADVYGDTSRELYDLVVGHAGLRIFDSDGNGPYTCHEFEGVFTLPMWNFIAVR